VDVIRRKIGFTPILALAALLLAAQGSALTHAYKHDAGSPQSQACIGCAAASQLDSGCVDNPEINDTRSDRPRLQAQQIEILESQHEVAVRQRGPPTPV